MNGKMCISKKIVFFGFVIGFISLLMTILSSSLLETKTTYQSKAATPAKPQAIYGGSDAEEGRWPFIGRLMRGPSDPYSNGFCDVTLVAQQWILTAAHCFDEEDLSNLYIFIGSRDLNGKAFIIKIDETKIYIHPDHTKNLEFSNEKDIAVAKLIEMVDLSIKPIQMNINRLHENEGQKSMMIGWGRVEGYIKPSILQQAVVSVLAYERVKNYEGYFTLMHLQNIAVGYPLGGTRSCKGDSGGPVVVWNGRRFVQIGVISASKKGGDKQSISYCSSPHMPTILASLSDKIYIGESVIYVNWIKEKLGSDFPTDDTGYFVGKNITEEESVEYNERICKREEWEDEWGNGLPEVCLLKELPKGGR